MNFRIARAESINASSKLESLDYQKWVNFIDSQPDKFVWNENTDEGRKTLENIDSFRERVRAKILSTLNKGVCLSEYDNIAGRYNISVTFYDELNWITINFARTPRPDDLKIFVEMAKHLDALLLVDGTHIIDENNLNELF